MERLTLEGNTLGEKHKYFNKLVHDAVTDKHINLSAINMNDSDIQNLFKIHTACKTKNVDYIMEVLKCEDMLYVSTAIKQSTWLITEQQYAHIVNPQYLYTQLFPHMLTKASKKLLLHIRLHLKHEDRVEAFYSYLKDTLSHEEAEKWLLNCSVPFIENVIKNERHISLQIYKRLCKRSSKFLRYYTKVEEQNKWRTLKTVLFVLKLDTEEYLNILDETNNYGRPSLGKKNTEIVMKRCPTRILNNFEKYVTLVDISTVAKYMKKEDIKSFIIKHSAKNNDTKYYFGNYKYLKHLIKNIPERDRFEFVKNVYIEKIEETHMHSESWPPSSVKTYEWYRFAPFSVAFTELKKLIRAESSSAERHAMMSVMITCAGNNLQDVKTVLHYYYDKHRNEPFTFKVQFVNNIITKTATHMLDNETWSILEKLFHSLEVYIESANDVQLCLKSIVVYKVLHDENVPDVVETKIAFDTFKEFHPKLDENQKEKLFSYLITAMSTKINSATIENESDFKNVLILLYGALDLLNYWKKNIEAYPFVRDTIQKLIKSKNQNSWQTCLSFLYYINKSWRRHLFQESMTLCPSEEVCLNALKHDPQLLDRHSEEMNALRTNDKLLLQQLLAKLRVYWPHSLAQQWADAYLNNINKSTGHTALTRGLFLLLPQNQIIDIAKKHVPKDFKIDWSEVNPVEVSLCKNIARHLHIARPMMPLDVVLLYAKGDYLQYAVPSLNSILYNMSKIQSRIHVPKLLEAPVSLQKFGLHLAFMKLEHNELNSIFLNVWQTTNNLSIRTHLFEHTYDLLCKVKDEAIAKNLWQVLSMFISNLTANDNKAIFKKLGHAENIHNSVRGEFYMKSYAFLVSLPPAVKCEKQKHDLIKCGSNIMDLLDSDFVADQILAPVEVLIVKGKFIDILCSYILHGKSEEEQCRRFRRVLMPALEYALTSWNQQDYGHYNKKKEFKALFKTLIWNFRKFLTLRKIVVPVKLFSDIQTFIETNMPLKENYVRYTCWKLLTEYVKLVDEHKDIFCDARLDNIATDLSESTWMPDDAEHVWEDLHIKISSQWGMIIVKHLKEDTEKYFPTIFWLFSQALDDALSYLSFQKSSMKIETLKYMIVDEDFVLGYIVACMVLPKHVNEKEMNKLIEIRKKIKSHPSEEVQMHYYKVFGDEPDTSS